MKNSYVFKSLKMAFWCVLLFSHAQGMQNEEEKNNTSAKTDASSKNEITALTDRAFEYASKNNNGDWAKFVQLIKEKPVLIRSIFVRAAHEDNMNVLFILYCYIRDNSTTKTFIEQNLAAVSTAFDDAVKRKSGEVRIFIAEFLGLAHLHEFSHFSQI
ncbi:MAG: hypothetical protein WCT20_00655 [Candidatus Babeliales bacterium]